MAVRLVRRYGSLHMQRCNLVWTIDIFTKARKSLKLDPDGPELERLTLFFVEISWLSSKNWR